MKHAMILALGLAVGTASAVETGNGAQSGPHFNLNLIGKTQCPTGNNAGGNVIFVLLNGGDNATNINGQAASTVSKVNKIYLTQSPDNTTFAVLDNTACDADGALFELPNPTTANYTIWARALATPGGSAILTTCATDTNTMDIVCSTQNAPLQPRFKGQSVFANVTAALTTIVLANGTVVPIFDPMLQNYFWNINNDGDRLIQLRFYPAQ
jgi:hypothetical protein